MRNYSERLKDPRWQKKRLEIMERDKFSCVFCYDSTSTLNVHHRVYFPNLEPWDYPDKLLITLCESCHKKEIDERKIYEQQLLNNLRILFPCDSIKELSTAFGKMELLHIPEIVCSSIADAIVNADMQSLLICKEFADWYYKNHDIDYLKQQITDLHNAMVDVLNSYPNNVHKLEPRKQGVNTNGKI